MQVEGGVWQYAGLESGIGIGIEVKAQHGGYARHGVGKQAVAVQQGFEAVQFFDKTLVPFLLGQGAQQFDIGALVALGEQHVETDHRGAVFAQVVHQGSELLAREGPVPVFLQAGLVDGDDHDALVHAARGGQAHAGIVEDVLDLVDVGNGVQAGDMTEHTQRRDDGQGGPGQVTLEGDIALLQEGKVHSFSIAPRMRSFSSSQGMPDDLSIRSASTPSGHG